MKLSVKGFFYMKDEVLAAKSVAEVLFKFWARLGNQGKRGKFSSCWRSSILSVRKFCINVKLLSHLLGNRVCWKMLCFLFSSKQVVQMFLPSRRNTFRWNPVHSVSRLKLWSSDEYPDTAFLTLVSLSSTCSTVTSLLPYRLPTR